MNNAHGQARRIGVELEFSGLAIERIAAICVDALGGRIEPVSPYETMVADTALGDFRVELDYAYLKKLGRREPDTNDLFGELEKLSEEMLAAVARRVVPFEIVSPPIAMAQLRQLQPLIESLRAAGARGTGDSPIYAFGLHLNPALPALDVATIRDYLRAWAVLFDWLRRVSRVDISRRAFPYIQPYPMEYNRLLIAPDYAPDLAQLIDDYLAFNASRNRALDMLPLFAYLDPERVSSVVEDDRVKGRPTLHYRLPNCDIERPGWNLDEPWGHWLAIERLAANAVKLNAACAAYREYLERPLTGLIGDWSHAGEAWI